ncbi:MAG: SCO family protein [Gammaproteobacteria bacterium]|nr:SCO family protein [Gammaproteobacteria bacterium]
MNFFTNKLLVTSLCLLALAGGYGAARLNDLRTAPPAVQNATELNIPRPLPQFVLIDHDGQRFTNDKLLNQWSILFFGFTNCPDVCPTTLSVLKNVYTHIVSLKSAVAPQIYLVSVDPQRDTPEKLASYVQFFHPGFVGLTGSEEAIDAFANAVGVARNRVPLEQGQYTVDHTSALFFIDPEGRTAAISSAPHVPGIIADDFLTIAGKR